MSKHLRSFDFSLLPSLERQSFFVRLDKDVDAALQTIAPLHEVYDRARAALMFFFQTDESSETWRNDARIRAGLNELYSMQDAANRGFRSVSMRSSSPKLSESDNPLIHLMYVLRHVNVHTTPLPSTVEAVTVIYQPKETPEELTYGAVVLAAITVEDLLRSKEILKYYDRGHLEASCNWLLKNQRIFGIAEVFSRGVNAYCRELLSSYAK